jgi:hypothetical protein
MPPKNALTPYNSRNTPTRSATYEPSMVDYRLHTAASGEIYRWGAHPRQQEEDSGEVPNRFVALVEVVSGAEVDESPPSSFPEPAGDDWDAFSQTAPHTPTQTLTQVSHLTHTHTHTHTPEDSLCARHLNRLATKLLGKTACWSRVLVWELGVLLKIWVLHRRTSYPRTNIHRSCRQGGVDGVQVVQVEHESCFGLATDSGATLRVYKITSS